MDRGRLVQGRLLRTSAGIEGVSATAETNLLGLDGQPLSEDDDDSEGLVLDGLGGFSVSFEGPARVWHYASPDAVPTEIKLSREFAQMQNNASLESLAAADGALLTMPERSGRFDKDFPIYRFDGTR